MSEQNCQPLAQQAKRRRVIRLGAIGVAGVAAFGSVLAVESRPELRPLEDLLLSRGSSVTAFSTLVTDHPWDIVCSLGPYSNVSGTLHRHYGSEFSRYNFVPRDVSLNDQQNSLAFIDIEGGKIYAYVIPSRSLRKIVGRECIYRGRAYFRVSYVKARNAEFHQLDMIEISR